MITMEQAKQLGAEADAMGEPQWDTDYERACEIQKARTAAHYAHCEAIRTRTTREG